MLTPDEEAELVALLEAEDADREREACQSLAEFIRRAWHAIEPGQPYVHGWHIDAICDHLEAISRGDLNRLLINIPPGTMKSLAVGVFWPAWEWGPLGRPATRVVAASHAQDLAIRDNLRTRRLVASDWYRRLWGASVVPTRDQNAKVKFENTATGFRQAAAAGSITGVRGDRVIIDDPLSVDHAHSEAHREAVASWFLEAVPTRLNNPDASAIVVVMQRLHERDVSGVILSRDLGYEHLCLPMEFEPERACRTSIGFVDPRTTPGQLLFPARFPAHVVERDKRVMGAYATAGQFQQRPVPREGGLFKRAWFVPAPAAPAVARRVRSWDLAGTQKKAGNNPDWTVGLRLSRDDQGVFYVEGVERMRESPARVEAAIRLAAMTDGTGVSVTVPQDPGQAGKAQAGTLVKMLAGWDVHAQQPTGDKETRARPAAAQAEAGNVRIIITGDPARDAWVEPFLEEVSAFPNAAHDDQVDAFADALNFLALFPVAPEAVSGAFSWG